MCCVIVLFFSFLIVLTKNFDNEYDDKFEETFFSRISSVLSSKC